MAHITAPDRLQQPPNALAAIRRYKQVNVIGHQHIGMDGTAVPLRRIAQGIQIERVVTIFHERHAAVIAPLHNVVGLATNVIAGMTGHQYPLTLELNCTLTPFNLTHAGCHLVVSCSSISFPLFRMVSSDCPIVPDPVPAQFVAYGCQKIDL
jgi:hypothetical protein